ncbi:hypothetical protein NMY22_g1801 [Coprinellus aureogranulatus]|nr:hypothetical protein NMY22_g1801 [Coprinellus aureogranulatus]
MSSTEGKPSVRRRIKELFKRLFRSNPGSRSSSPPRHTSSSQLSNAPDPQTSINTHRASGLTAHVLQVPAIGETLERALDSPADIGPSTAPPEHSDTASNSDLGGDETSVEGRTVCADGSIAMEIALSAEPQPPPALNISPPTPHSTNPLPLDDYDTGVPARIVNVPASTSAEVEPPDPAEVNRITAIVPVLPLASPLLSEAASANTFESHPGGLLSTEAALAAVPSQSSEVLSLASAHERNISHRHYGDTCEWAVFYFENSVDNDLVRSLLVAPLQAVLQMKDVIGDEQQDFKRLEDRVRVLDAILGSFPQDASQDIKDRRDGLERLEEKIRPSGKEQTTFTDEEKQEVSRLVREVNFAIEISMLDVAVRGETLILQVVDDIDWLKGHYIEEQRKVHAGMKSIHEGVLELRKAELFKKLGNVSYFGFSNGTRRPECIPGSRIGLLSQLLAWAEIPSSGHAFWLSGGAGTGKTAVSETFCSQLVNRGLLGASFFCSVTDQDLSDIYLIIPSLAKCLAEAHPAFGDALAIILETLTRGSQNPLTMKLEKQYQLLVLSPGEKAFSNSKIPVTLCVDAVDECRNRRALREFFEAILRNSPVFPLKIFFTSRPEAAIRDQLESLPYLSLRHSLRLHDIESSVVRADIELYVNRELWNIEPLRQKYGHCWPPPEVQNIVEHAGTLFIVAATMIRYIDDEAGNRIKRFQMLGSADAPRLVGIYQLYHDILKRVTEPLENEERDDLNSCLSLLVVALRPLTVTQYAGLLQRDSSSIQEILRSLHSVVKMPRGSDETGTISIYHASFIDFLMAQATSIAPPWMVERAIAHTMVLECCIKLLNDDQKGLYFGVSGATTSYVSNHEQPSRLSLRSDLAYACTAWGDHTLGAKPISDILQSQIKEFLKEKWLFWIEALSVESDTRYARMMWQISKEAATLDELKILLSRISDFWRMFATPISHSAPHLYLSALPLYEATLGSSDWIVPEFRSIPTITMTGLTRASRTCKVMDAPSAVWSVAISLDENRVAAGCHDGHVRVWDVWSGELCLDLEGHTNMVTSVQYSPDGTQIASGCWGGEIWLFDAESGKAVQGPLTGHAGAVKSVRFDPADGTRFASASGDTIRVWDLETGKSILNPLNLGDGLVMSIDFSRDGRIVYGCTDGAVRVWGVETGENILGPLKGHTDRIHSTTFSPDGQTLASGSDDGTVRLWDAKTGSIVHGPLYHPRSVPSACFSPDGKAVVSGCLDAMVRVWDISIGKVVIGPLQGHTQQVNSVCFAGGGKRVVSGSGDNTVRVWDTETIRTEQGPLERHNGSIGCVRFSPDGTRIVSGSFDGSIRVWDVTTGQTVIGPLWKHTGWVESVDISPDGRRLVSGSSDRTLRVWDMERGETVVGPMMGHSDRVTCVCFSPDGKVVASGSWDRTVRVWDTKTGDTVLGPLEGHTDRIHCVTFSPCGRRIASASTDKTMRVWDVETGETGEMVLGPLDGHRGWVWSVSYSPDGTKIVSGSEDGEIRVWDSQTGSTIGAPLVGHASGVTAVSFSPNGKFIASGSADTTIRVWDAETGKNVLGPLGNTTIINSIHFSPDGQRIMSGLLDKTIQVWNVQSAQQEGAREGFSGSGSVFLHDYSVSSLGMDDNGWIRNGSDDLLLWVPPQFRPSLCLPLLERIISGAQTTIELTNAVHHGANWRRCIESPDKSVGTSHWPISVTSKGPPSARAKVYGRVVE